MFSYFLPLKYHKNYLLNLSYIYFIWIIWKRFFEEYVQQILQHDLYTVYTCYVGRLTLSVYELEMVAEILGKIYYCP